LIRWPWVSRRAYDVLVDERDRLRTQNDMLLDHVKRIDRTEHGLGELPRPQRPVVDPMPTELRKHIEGFADPRVRKTIRDQCYRRHASGVKWSVITKYVMSNDEQEPE